MTRLPRATGKDVVRALQKVGFAVERTRRSHVILKHADGHATAVPVHSGEVLGPGLLPSILRDTKLAVDDLADLFVTLQVGQRLFIRDLGLVRANHRRAGRAGRAEGGL